MTIGCPTDKNLVQMKRCVSFISISQMHKTSKARTTCETRKANLHNTAFACILSKKLKQVAARNRIIQRNFKSMSTIDKRFLTVNRCEVCVDGSKGNDMDSSNGNDKISFEQEDLIPQKLWDELFDSAFQAIAYVSTDFFNEK